MTAITKNHVDLEQMQLMLKHSVAPQIRVGAKNHINTCQHCWNLWNKVRWDRAMSSKGIQELQEYLGESFVTYFDSSLALANEWNLERRLIKEDVESFYQKTNNYLYNLTVFYESGDRTNFKSLIQKLAENKDLTTIMDYGCGVGNDTLDLVEAGFRVLSIDFDSPTLDFLRWRLGKRGIPKEQCQVIPLEKINSHKEDCFQADMFWAVDVLEHMFDPFEVFEYISDDIRFFSYFVDSDDKANGRHPFHFDFPTAQFNERLRMRKLKLCKDYDPQISVWMR